MKLHALIGLILLPSSFLFSAPPSPQLKHEVFRASSGDRFSLELPSAWSVDTQVGAGLGINTLRILNTEGTGVLMISAIPGKESAAETLDQLEQILRTSVRALAEDSVEHEVRTLSFSSKTSFGVYATLTDSRRLGQKLGTGEYRFSTTFVLNCSKRIVTVTFLNNEEPFDSVELVIMILKTLQREEGHS